MARFSPQRWHRLLDLFDLIRQVPPLDREEFGRHLCPDDHQVQATALLMAEALDSDPEFMELGPHQGSE